MASRIASLIVLLSASPLVSADPSATFAPEFFAFENGVRFGPAEAQVEVLKELGYDSLGSAKPHDLPARLELHKAAGVPISSLYLGGPIGKPVSAGIADAVGQLGGYDTMIELFVQRGGGNTDEEAVAYVREVADLAKKAGLKVVLYPHSGFYVDTLDDAVRIAKLAGRDNVGAMFNLCHFLKVEPKADLRAALEGAGDLLWRVSICGADSEGTSWNTLIQPLDQGTFDQAALLRTLRELGFTGDVGLQCYAVKGDPKENLRRSISAWKEYLRASRED